MHLLVAYITVSIHILKLETCKGHINLHTCVLSVFLSSDCLVEHGWMLAWSANAHKPFTPFILIMKEGEAGTEKHSSWKLYG